MYTKAKRKGYKGKEILKLVTISELLVFESFFSASPPKKKEIGDKAHTYIERDIEIVIERPKKRKAHIYKLYFLN